MIEYIDVSEIKSIFSISSATVYRRVKSGIFPSPLKFGGRAIWPKHEIKSVSRAILSGKQEDEIRELVATLIASRQEA